jgi:hypothetical protein
MGKILSFIEFSTHSLKLGSSNVVSKLWCDMENIENGSFIFAFFISFFRALGKKVANQNTKN